MVASSAPSRTREVSPIIIALAAGIIWWGIGFLPWIFTGLNGEYGLVPETATTSAVPYRPNSSDWVRGDFGFVGGLCASGVWLLARLVGRRVWLASLTGIMAAIAVAFVQTYIAAAAERDLEILDYQLFALSAAVCVGGSLAGWGLGVAITRGAVWIGMTLAALTAMGSPWYWVVITRYVNFTTGQDGNLRPGDGMYEIVSRQWVGVIAVALIAIGARPLLRLAFWPVAIAVSLLVSLPELLVRSLAYELVHGEYLISADEFWIWVGPDGRTIVGHSIALALAGLVTAALAYSRSHRERQPGPRVYDDQSSLTVRERVGRSR